MPVIYGYFGAIVNPEPGTAGRYFIVLFPENMYSRLFKLSLWYSGFFYISFCLGLHCKKFLLTQETGLIKPEDRFYSLS